MLLKYNKDSIRNKLCHSSSHWKDESQGVCVFVSNQGTNHSRALNWGTHIRATKKILTGGAAARARVGIINIVFDGEADSFGNLQRRQPTHNTLKNCYHYLERLSEQLQGFSIEINSDIKITKIWNDFSFWDLHPYALKHVSQNTGFVFFSYVCVFSLEKMINKTQTLYIPPLSCFSRQISLIVQSTPFLHKPEHLSRNYRYSFRLLALGSRANVYPLKQKENKGGERNM